jgi:hypothetical protein
MSGAADSDSTSIVCNDRPESIPDFGKTGFGETSLTRTGPCGFTTAPGEKSRVALAIGSAAGAMFGEDVADFGGIFPAGFASCSRLFTIDRASASSV